jgi:hypothetical protein
MSIWLYRVAMTLLLANLGLCIYMAVTQPPVMAQCINGYVMVISRDHSMYQQRAVFVAERCVAIDRD